ncbi:hypothetical protein CC79DRAFT_1371243 [Sarocladium strictum]
MEFHRRGGMMFPGWGPPSPPPQEQQPDEMGEQSFSSQLASALAASQGTLGNEFIEWGCDPCLGQTWDDNESLFGPDPEDLDPVPQQSPGHWQQPAVQGQPARDARFSVSAHRMPVQEQPAAEPAPVRRSYPNRVGKTLNKKVCTKCRKDKKPCFPPTGPCERCVHAGWECFRDGIDRREKQHRRNRGGQREELTPPMSDPESGPEVASSQGDPYHWIPSHLRPDFGLA